MQHLQAQLGHADIKQTMKYALYHPNYSDLSPYFTRSQIASARCSVELTNRIVHRPVLHQPLED